MPTASQGNKSKESTRSLHTVTSMTETETDCGKFSATGFDAHRHPCRKQTASAGIFPSRGPMVGVCNSHIRTPGGFSRSAALLKCRVRRASITSGTFVHRDHPQLPVFSILPPLDCPIWSSPVVHCQERPNLRNMPCRSLRSAADLPDSRQSRL